VAARAARALRRGLRAASARPVTPLVVLFTANAVNAVVCTRLCAATTALLVLATYSENMSCCGTNVSISPRPGPHAPAQPQGGPSTPTTAGAQEGRTADCAPLLLPPLPRHLTAARRYTCISPRPCSSAAQASAESSKEVSRSQGVTAPCLRPCTRRDAPLCRPPQRVLIHAHRRALRTSARMVPALRDRGWHARPPVPAALPAPQIKSYIDAVTDNLALQTRVLSHSTAGEQAEPVRAARAHERPQCCPPRVASRQAQRGGRSSKRVPLRALHQRGPSAKLFSEWKYSQWPRWHSPRVRIHKWGPYG